MHKTGFIWQSLPSPIHNLMVYCPLCCPSYAISYSLFSFFFLGFSNNHSGFFALFLFLEFLLHSNIVLNLIQHFWGIFKNNNHSTVLGIKFSLPSTAQWLLQWNVQMRYDMGTPRLYWKGDFPWVLSQLKPFNLKTGSVFEQVLFFLLFMVYTGCTFMPIINGNMFNLKPLALLNGVVSIQSWARMVRGNKTKWLKWV